MKKAGVEARFETKTYAKLKLNYIVAGQDSGACVVFVHGSPGANNNFSDYMKDSSLLNKACLLALDRPGYGYSDRTKLHYTLQEQSACIGGLLADLHRTHKRIIVVGHSYGGSMAAKLAMDYDTILFATIQISGAVDPENEKMFWFSKLAHSPLVFWSLSRTLQVTANEKMKHAEDLKKSLTAWDSITKKVTVIHGDKDQLVPYSNLQYTKSKLTHTDAKTISIKKGGHLLIWDEYVLIRNEIVLLLK